MNDSSGLDKIREEANLIKQLETLQRIYGREADLNLSEAKAISKANKEAYEATAEEYNENWRSYIDDVKPIIDEYASFLPKPSRILDLGCGVGLNSFILSENGYDVIGVDIAPKMVQFARLNAPKANFVCGDFFDLQLDIKFDGIVMMAFIHLFPKEVAMKILIKLKDIISDDGAIFIATTVSDESKEGYFEKDGYGDKTKRFRKFWTENELVNTLRTCGFHVVKNIVDADSVYDKKWLNLICKIKE